MTDQPGSPLRVDVDASGVVVIHGDIDLAGGRALEDHLHAGNGRTPTVFDLTDVDFIDSSGLRTLLVAGRRARDDGQLLELRNPTPAVRRILEITGTTEQFRTRAVSLRPDSAGQFASSPARRGPVEITMPADAELVSAIRLTASGIAASARCTLDEIDDVKLAVSEVLLALLEHGRGDVLSIALRLDESRFSIRGRAAADGFDPDDPDLALCRTVLDELCASHSIDFADRQLKIDAAVPVLAAASRQEIRDNGR